MRNIHNSLLVSEAVAAAALCLAWQAAADAQSYAVQPSYGVRPTCNSASPCIIRPGTYGYNDTTWRMWPTQYRPEVSDPRAIGARRIPAPPGTPEPKYPPAGGVPGKPPIGGGEILPGNIGPFTSGANTSPAAPGLTVPGEKGPIAPGPDMNLPGDLGTPKLPEILPGAEGGSAQPSDKTRAAPDTIKPDAGPITPPTKEPAGNEPATRETPKTPGVDKRDSGPPSFAPPKADTPSAPGDITPGKPSPSAALRQQRGAVAAVGADWNDDPRAIREPGLPLRPPASNSARPSVALQHEMRWMGFALSHSATTRNGSRAAPLTRRPMTGRSTISPAQQPGSGLSPLRRNTLQCSAETT